MKRIIWRIISQAVHLSQGTRHRMMNRSYLRLQKTEHRRLISFKMSSLTRQEIIQAQMEKKKRSQKNRQLHWARTRRSWLSLGSPYSVEMSSTNCFRKSFRKRKKPFSSVRRPLRTLLAKNQKSRFAFHVKLWIVPYKTKFSPSVSKAFQC